MGRAHGGRPPHRSRRAELPHRAPALGQTRSRWPRGMTYSVQRTVRVDLALSPEPGLPVRISLGQTPSLHPLRRSRPRAAFVRELLRYYGPVRLPAFVHHGRTPLGFTVRTTFTPWSKTGSPGFRVRCFGACSGSKTARSPCPSRHDDGHGVAFRTGVRASTLRTKFITQFTTRPAPSPVNASHGPLRTHRHDSGPAWLANPSLCKTFICNTLPAFPGASPLISCSYPFAGNALLWREKGWRRWKYPEALVAEQLVDKMPPPASSMSPETWTVSGAAPQWRELTS